MVISAKDRKIIAYLRKNARIPLTKMSKKTHIPVSTIFDRLKTNEKDLILKHTTLLNFETLGYHTRANITIKADRESREELKQYLLKHEMVNSLYQINNGFDFMIEGIFRQIKDMEDFLGSLEDRFKIKDKKTYFIVEDLKREGFMENPDLIKEPQ